MINDAQQFRSFLPAQYISNCIKEQQLLLYSMQTEKLNSAYTVADNNTH